MGAKGIADRIGRVEYKATALSDHMVLEFRLNQQIERRGGGVCTDKNTGHDLLKKSKVTFCIILSRRSNKSSLCLYNINFASNNDTSKQIYLLGQKHIKVHLEWQKT